MEIADAPVARTTTYHGLDEVFDYFRRRRDLATSTFRMHRRDVLAGDGDRIAALTERYRHDRRSTTSLVDRRDLRRRGPDANRRLLAAAI